MGWLSKRVWQLGIAVLLALVGAVLMYLGGTDGVEQTTLWIGLILAFLALAIPLFSKAFLAAQGEDEEEE